MPIPVLLPLAFIAAPAPATNTVCPTCPMKVNEKSPVVEVRGRKYRVCCANCGKDLSANPDKYLDAKGEPKNAKK